MTVIQNDFTNQVNNTVAAVVAWAVNNNTHDGRDFSGSEYQGRDFCESLAARLNENFNALQVSCYIKKIKDDTRYGVVIKIISKANKSENKNCTYHISFGGCYHNNNGRDIVYSGLNALETT